MLADHVVVSVEVASVQMTRAGHPLPKPTVEPAALSPVRVVGVDDVSGLHIVKGDWCSWQ